MAVWLVTGATGFVGRHVWDLLGRSVEQPSRFETEVLAMGRRRPPGCPEHRFITTDLNDATGLVRAIRRIAPNYVIHTAGRTPPATDDELFRTNFWSTTHLLSGLRTLEKPIRVVLSGSAAELGPVASAHLPVDEGYAGCPIDAYGRSKRLATLSGLAERPPLEVVVARVFNVVGPGLPQTQAFGRFASRLDEPGPDPVELTVGDLEARRDFIDVRDVARAMIAIALRGQAGQVYNVGTGHSRQVAEGLDILVRLSGRSVRTRVDPALQERRGPSDSRAAIGRIVTQTGWEPRIPLEQSLSDLWCEVRSRQTGKLQDSVGMVAPWWLPLTA
jgi:GDP-4-dehydro-6-deoxy-D-mannose reductase